MFSKATPITLILLPPASNILALSEDAVIVPSGNL